MGLGQYDSLGEYCALCTASSVFLISNTSINPPQAEITAFGLSDQVDLKTQNVFEISRNLTCLSGR